MPKERFALKKRRGARAAAPAARAGAPRLRAAHLRRQAMWRRLLYMLDAGEGPFAEDDGAIDALWGGADEAATLDDDAPQFDGIDLLEELQVVVRAALRARLRTARRERQVYLSTH